ncbi:MAG: hypothetical protein ACTSPP_10070 [Candidatus Heimdallarchaeaceae archaeon]
MKFEKYGFHTLIGTMTTDYFVFICEECGNKVDIEFLGLDPAIPKFKAVCSTCEKEIPFKVEIRKGREKMSE